MIHLFKNREDNNGRDYKKRACREERTDTLAMPFLIVYNVTGVDSNGFQACDIARIKEIPENLLG